jgi:hypothetical protein
MGVTNTVSQSFFVQRFVKTVSVTKKNFPAFLMYISFISHAEAISYSSVMDDMYGSGGGGDGAVILIFVAVVIYILYQNSQRSRREVPPRSMSPTTGVQEMKATNRHYSRPELDEELTAQHPPETLGDLIEQLAINPYCPYCDNQLIDYEHGTDFFLDSLDSVGSNDPSASAGDTVFICCNCHSKKSDNPLLKFCVEQELDVYAIRERLLKLNKNV